MGSDGVKVVHITVICALLRLRISVRVNRRTRCSGAVKPPLSNFLGQISCLNWVSSELSILISPFLFSVFFFKSEGNFTAPEVLLMATAGFTEGSHKTGHLEEILETLSVFGGRWGWP